MKKERRRREERGRGGRGGRGRGRFGRRRRRREWSEVRKIEIERRNKKKCGEGVSKVFIEVIFEIVSFQLLPKKFFFSGI